MMDGARKRSVRAALSLHGAVEMTTWRQQATYNIGPPRGRAGIGARHRVPKIGPRLRSRVSGAMRSLDYRTFVPSLGLVSRRILLGVLNPFFPSTHLAYTTSNKL